MPDSMMAVEADYVRVDLLSDWTPGNEVAEFIQTYSKATTACRDHSLDKILAVIHVGGAFPVSVAYEVMSDPTVFGWQRNYKGAVVYLDEERFNSNLFTETVAVNRDFAIKAFCEEGEALRWLLQD